MLRMHLYCFHSQILIAPAPGLLHNETYYKQLRSVFVYVGISYENWICITLLLMGYFDNIVCRGIISMNIKLVGSEVTTLRFGSGSDFKNSR